MMRKVNCMQTRAYDRAAATAYAGKWAFGRNPAYADFTKMGGDCTNFVSQCLYAGSGVMNQNPVFGWYYRSLNDRAPAWTGVEALFRFLTRQEGPGPFAEICSMGEVLPGDLIQLENTEKRFYHGLLVIKAGVDPLVAAHDQDAWMRPLFSYPFWGFRCLHIEAVRL